MQGTSDTDTLTTGNGDDSIDGGAGNDLIDGGSGNDTIFGYFAITNKDFFVLFAVSDNAF